VRFGDLVIQQLSANPGYIFAEFSNSQQQSATVSIVGNFSAFFSAFSASFFNDKTTPFADTGAIPLTVDHQNEPPRASLFRRTCRHYKSRYEVGEWLTVSLIYSHSLFQCRLLQKTLEEKNEDVGKKRPD
jgi:hypothetical protein